MASALRFLIPPIVGLLLPSDIHGRPGVAVGLQRDLPLDPTDPSDKAQDIRDSLIKDLKSTILRKLRLPSPPSGFSSPPHLSSDVMELLQREQRVSQIRPKENLIVHAHNTDFNCSKNNNTRCRKLEFNITSDLQSVTSVHAWFHKLQPLERLTLSVYSSISSEDSLMIKLKELKDSSKMTLKSGWIMFELPKIMSLELRNNHLLCTFETEGTDIHTDGDQRPFLVLTKHNRSVERKRRTVNESSSNCSCCTDNHYISVKDLGWSDWVISPEGFDVKTCRGQCEENQSSFTLNYQRIINTLYKFNKTLQRPKCNLWAPSCQPDSYLPERMIFRMENGTWLDQSFEDMLIGSCSCR